MAYAATASPWPWLAVLVSAAIWAAILLAVFAGKIVYPQRPAWSPAATVGRRRRHLRDRRVRGRVSRAKNAFNVRTSI